MKTITIPPAVIVPGPNGPFPYSFSDFLAEIAWVMPVWRESAALAQSCLRIASDAANLVSVVVDDEDHVRLVQCVRSATIPPKHVVAVMTFVHAVLAAEETSP